MGASKTCKAHEGKGQQAGQHQAHCGTLADAGHLGQFKFFTQTRHHHQRNGETDTCTHAESEALQKIVLAEGLEQGQAENRTVGGDQGQENTQRPTGWG